MTTTHSTVDRMAEANGVLAAKRIRSMRAARYQRYLDTVGGKPWTVYLTASNRRVDTVVPIRCEDSNGPVAFATFKEADAWCAFIRRDWLGHCSYEVRRV